MNFLSPTSSHWPRVLSIASSLLAVVLSLHVPIFAAPFASIPRLSQTTFLDAFEQTVAPSDSGTFIPLADESQAQDFSSLLEVLLRGDIAAADEDRQRLADEGVQYRLVNIIDNGDTILGFLEAVRPGNKQYRGWGAALARLSPECDRVYAAPHVQSDQYSEMIALRAFMDDPKACTLLLAGARRDADSGNVSGEDAANSTENLFHSLTAWLARRGLAIGRPLWFVQFHGADDRSGQPSIVGSNGSRAASPAGSPLAMIEDEVDAGGHVRMGVCGQESGLEKNQNGDYHLCATGNAQGHLLAKLGVPQTFLHLEIERHVREGFQHGTASGKAAVRDLLTAVRDVLNETGSNSVK